MPAFSRWMIGSLTCAFLTAAFAHGDEPVKYNRDIRPILAENCFACHGPDSAARKADLRIDKRDGAIDGGAIVPGKPDESEMIKRILSTDPAVVMPPPTSHKQIKPAQVETLKRWIAQGAEYMPHWSLIAPTRPAFPAVRDEAWIRNPIDRFTLAALEAKGLSPAPEADRRTLARRVSFDLTGLPPAPELVEAFVADQDPAAYEKLVDQLLNEKTWGEHRGRYWLDAARYADTHGIHFDNYRENWAYRDWVIEAFNRNLPFDQFTIEQLAGDLLPERTLDQQVASAFNRCNITTSEGGAIDEEYLVLYNRDRTETTAQVWMGMTLGCAVCHDHKFDPFSQRQFYELAAFFNNTTQRAMDGNAKDTPPVVQVPKPEDRPRYGQIPGELAAARQAAEARRKEARPDFDAWAKGDVVKRLADSVPQAGLSAYAKLSEGAGTNVSFAIAGAEGKLEERKLEIPGGLSWQPAQAAGSACRVDKPGVVELADLGDFERDKPFSYGAWVKPPANVNYAAIFARMDGEDAAYRGWDLWMDQGLRPGVHLVNSWPNNAVKVVSNNPIPADQWAHVFVTYDGSSKAAGLKVYINGEAQPTSVQSDNLSESIRTKTPWKLAQRSKGQGIAGLGIHELRMYDRALPPEEVRGLAQAAQFAEFASKPAGEWTDAEREKLFGWWLPGNDKPFQDAKAKEAALVAEESTIRARGTIAHVMNENAGMAPKAFVLFRGEYDKRRDEVQPNTPEVLPAYPADFPRNRLGFARWLLLPEQPLTARVTVNRFWQEVFGQGIVRTSGDFGVAGELPSHPELLDWLAIEFREQGWDVKKFFKLMVMSNTYRQSAASTPEKREKDAGNRFLSRGPRFRMDAEMVRDAALSAAGVLSPKIGGPSVKPYQPDGVWEAVAMIGSNTRDYKADTGENLYRRGLYTFWKRSAPPASLEIFNAPNREFCAVRRERTNTPLQALVTLNDPQFVEAARNLAQRSLTAGGDDAAKLDFVAKRLIARGFDADETAVVMDSLKALREHYAANAEDAKRLLAVGESKPDASIPPAELAAWTMLCNELMNLDEVLNK